MQLEAEKYFHKVKCNRKSSEEVKYKKQKKKKHKKPLEENYENW